MGATTEGQEVAPPTTTFSKSHQCVNCQTVANAGPIFMQCSGCKVVRYCGRQCQREHWSRHKRLCQAIQQLEVERTSQVVRGDGYVFTSQLTPTQQLTVAKLVSKKSRVLCSLSGVTVDALWDTGAQVSIVSKSWLRENLTSLELRKINELLGEGVELDLRVANGGKIPCLGWVEVEFKLTCDTQSSVPLTVPILVARDELEYPIIGYNAIEEVIRNKGQKEGQGAIVDIMSSAFVDVNVESVGALVEFVQGPEEESLCWLRSGENNVLVPAGQSVMVPSHASCGPRERRTPVLFEPTPDSTWPADLEASEQRLTLPRGVPNRVKLCVPCGVREEERWRLRLCVDYRELNRKTLPVRHPIPRIQETLDNLGGNAWFSVIRERHITKALLVKRVNI